MRLVACDGSDLNISYNTEDIDTYFQHGLDGKGFNQIHLNALYDLGSRRYINAVIQPGRKKNECQAMAKMIDRYTGNSATLFMADRGYECFLQDLFGKKCRTFWRILHLQIGENCRGTGRSFFTDRVPVQA